MVPWRQQDPIYDLVPQGIAVLTVQHQVRDIESLIAAEFLASAAPAMMRRWLTELFAKYGAIYRVRSDDVEIMRLHHAARNL